MGKGVGKGVGDKSQSFYFVTDPFNSNDAYCCGTACIVLKASLSVNDPGF